MSKLTFNYTFKKMAAAAFGSLVAAFEPAEQERIRAQFETLEEGKYYKRKPEPVELTLPTQLDTLTGSPEEIALFTGAVTRLITEFVKYQYIDNFLPVGDHSLDAIAKVQAESGSRGATAFAIDEAVYAKAVTSLEQYLAAVLNNAPAAEKVANIAKQRFTRSAITRGLGNFSEEVLNKLQVRLDAWAVAISQQPGGDEMVEEFAPVHALWTGAINRLLKADANIDIASIL